MKQQQTFTLDINFFDDDRMIPVAVHYGAIGQLVAIHLISMIYRNGYYLDWTELNRCRLIRAIPTLTLDTLDAIVECLISSGLFDADCFTRHGILTSPEIQTQYLRTHRRRIKPHTPLPYFLIPIPEKKAKPTKAPTPSREETIPDLPETPEPLDLPDLSDPSENLENLETPETPEGLDTLAIPDLPEPLDPSDPSDPSEIPDTLAIPDLPEPLDLLDLSDPSENLETSDTLDILGIPAAPAPPENPKSSKKRPPLPRGVKLIPRKPITKKRHRKQRF